MGNIFVHWANFDVDCGIFDAGICPNCGKHTFFNLQKRHKHLFLSWLCAMLGYDKVIQSIAQIKTNGGI